MLKFKMAHRVAVYRGASVFYRAPAAAQHLLDSQLATVRKRVAKVITEIELAPEATGYMQGQVRADQLGLRAGSFGIRVETFPSGLSCFDHRNVWEQVVPA
jgi:DUF1680 family protein